MEVEYVHIRGEDYLDHDCSGFGAYSGCVEHQYASCGSASDPTTGSHGACVAKVVKAKAKKRRLSFKR